MNDEEFTQRIKVLKAQFEERVKALRSEYHRKIQEIAKSIEQRRLSGLKKDLGI